MANDFYNASGSPSLASTGSSAIIRAEFDAVAAGFDKLPTFASNANKPVVVNSGATGLTTLGSTFALAGNFALSGSYAISLTATGSVITTLPGVSGTLFTLAGSVTLTNKTFSSPTFSGTATGTYTIGGTPTYPTGATFASPVLTGSITGTYTIGGTPTFTSPTVAASTFTSPVFEKLTVSSGPLTLTSGQITFASSPALDGTGTSNALYDYEEGTWTPTLTFETPGDVSVSYTTRLGTYTKVGRLVTVSVAIVTSAFTHTTAANQLQISGLPFTAASNGWYGTTTSGGEGPCAVKGITIATKNNCYRISAGWWEGATTTLNLEYSGDTQWGDLVVATMHSSGTNVTLYGTVSYLVQFGL